MSPKKVEETRALAPQAPIPIRPGDEREFRPAGEGVAETFEDGLIVVFPEIGCRFELTAVEIGDDPSAMVALYRGANLVHQAKLLLYGVNARPRFAQNLSKRTQRWDFKVDWDMVLEQVVKLAGDFIKTGEPLVDLWEVDPPATTPYLFAPLLPLNEVTFIYGEGGTLKSYLALLLCLAVTCAISVAVWGRPAVTGNVLYLDWETNPNTHARRLRAIAAGIDMRDREVIGRIYYRRMKAPIHLAAPQIRKLIRENDVKLVVIDSAGMSTGGNVNAPDDVVRTMDAISTLGAGCSKLLIGHKNKDGDFIGNVYWRNQSRACWDVNAEQAGRTQKIAWVNTKNNDDLLSDPKAAAVEFEPGGRIIWEEIDPGTVQIARERLRDVDKVLIAIQELDEEGTPPTIDLIQERSGIASAGSVRTWVNILVKEGKVRTEFERPGPGRPQVYRPVRQVVEGRVIAVQSAPAPPAEPEAREDEDDVDEQPLPF